MRYRTWASVIILALIVVAESGCATKKYVRTRIAERVQPLENRTSELEETSRRNTQQISELSASVEDVRGRAGRAQETADRAASAAEQANTRVSGVERSIEELRGNLDKYSLQNTAMVFFAPGSARLTNEAMAQLDQLASQIGNQSGFILEIVGYGDTARPTRYNQSLAQMRAEAVQRYLADKKNIPIMRMFSLGLGSSRPMTQAASTASEVADDRSLNRRVEIKLLTNEAVPNPPMRSRPATGSP